MNLRKISILLIVLLALLTYGCASISRKASLEKISLVTETYRDAIRASEFKVAYGFMDPETTKDQEVDFEQYKNIEVVEYKVVSCGLSENRLEYYQVAEIEYYTRSGLILRTISDKQLWKFDEKAKIWRLQTGLPDFQQKNNSH